MNDTGHDPERAAKPRIGPAMRRCAEYAAEFPGESVTTVLRACGIGTTHSGDRQPIYRAEAAGLLYIDRVRSNLYLVYPSRRSAEVDRSMRAAQREAQRCGDPIVALEILRRADEIRWSAG